MSGKDSNLHGTRRPRGYGPVPCLVGVRSVDGLAGRIRTCGFLVPNEARSPLRHSECEMVETMGLKPTSFACKANALSVELHPRGVPGRN